MLLYAAGLLDLHDAVKIVYLGYQIQDKTVGKGSTLAIGLSATEAWKLLRKLRLDGMVEIAALNGLNMTIRTGEVTGLRRVVSTLEASIFTRFINMNTQYHSHFMDMMKSDRTEALSTMQGAMTDATLYSTAIASIEPGTHLTREYWYENVRDPVRLVKTVTHMIEDSFQFFVDIRPHPVLVSGTLAVDVDRLASQKARVAPSIDGRHLWSAGLWQAQALIDDAITNHGALLSTPGSLSVGNL